MRTAELFQALWSARSAVQSNVTPTGEGHAANHLINALTRRKRFHHLRKNSDGREWPAC